MPSHGPAMVDGLLLFSFILVARDILDLDYLGLDLDYLGLDLDYLGLDLSYLGLDWDERGRKGIVFIVFFLISDSANIRFNVFFLAQLKR